MGLFKPEGVRKVAWKFRSRVQLVMRATSGAIRRPSKFVLGGGSLNKSKRRHQERAAQIMNETEVWQQRQESP